MAKENSAHPTIYLKDYQAPDFEISGLELEFNLEPEQTVVTARSEMKKITAASDLVLYGDELTLLNIKVNDKELAATDYKIDENNLTLLNVPEQFSLEIQTQINPQANTALSGLYLSKGIFCTQCEAHGFRRITYFLDRPDVMTVYRTKIIADKAAYPQLLSNGNLLETGSVDSRRHYAIWEDPFKKPSYLFALVAGQLECFEEIYTTRSGREITCQLFVEPGNLDKCEHAMASLHKAMRWDEEVYQREYDLDIYMIVAVSAFNMGAMENKGLNIFNDKYVLANPATATDQDFAAVESVIAHEYFHNWTGNRITCRDWFQLSLKEGLTVFRDQEFSRDMNDRDVNRIEDVQVLRAHQFPEDDSPLAHPVRPESYIEVNNFYTATVYNKGAEVIRMQQTLLSDAGFQKGMQLYFARHDGQAVTTDDFVACMADANEVSLEQFKHWYNTAGTPKVTLRHQYDEQAKECTITVQQEAGNLMHIPLRIGVLDADGSEQLADKLLEITEQEQSFTLKDIKTAPVLSLLRDFSAPIKLQHDLPQADLLTLLAHDSNGFARWEAGQCLLINALKRCIDDTQNDKPLGDFVELAEAIGHVLEDAQNNPALAAKLLQLPDFNFIADQIELVDVAAIIKAKKHLRALITKHNQAALLKVVQATQRFDSYERDAHSIGLRSLKNTCLDLLLTLENDAALALCTEQFQRANNMTDSLSALASISHYAIPEREALLQVFFDKWAGEELVLDKWFSIQARAQTSDTLQRVQQLLTHESFTYENPNRIRALIGAFAAGNPGQFHQLDGSGYDFLREQILVIDKRNPQVAARLVSPLTRWRRFIPTLAQAMQQSLEHLHGQPGLSPDVSELVAKSL